MLLLFNSGYNENFAHALDSLRLRNVIPGGLKLVEQVHSAALYEVKDTAVLASFKQYSTSGF